MKMDVKFGTYDKAYNIWIKFKGEKFLCKEWQKYSNFVAWWDAEELRNPNRLYFDKYSAQLEKHVLSPETCFLNDYKFKTVCLTHRMFVYKKPGHKSKPWYSSFKFVKTPYFLGYFATEDEAVQAMKKKRSQLMIDLAKTDIHPMLAKGLIIHAEEL